MRLAAKLLALGVAGAILVHVFEIHLFAAQCRGALKCFQDRDAVGATAAYVINFAAAWFFAKSVDKTRNIQGMDIVAHLLAFIPENFVKTAFDIALDEIA